MNPSPTTSNSTVYSAMFRGFRAGTIMVVPNTLSLALEEVASPSFVS